MIMFICKFCKLVTSITSKDLEKILPLKKSGDMWSKGDGRDKHTIIVKIFHAQVVQTQEQACVIEGIIQM